MNQQAAAYARFRSQVSPTHCMLHLTDNDIDLQGQPLWNEAAFDRKEALYEGTIKAVPFKHVVKTFQVRYSETTLRTNSSIIFFIFNFSGESLEPID